MITCQYCHATTHQIQVGKLNTGANVYHCRHCDQLYVPDWKRGKPSDAVPKFDTVNDGGGDENDSAFVAPTASVGDEVHVDEDGVVRFAQHRNDNRKSALQGTIGLAQTFIETWLSFIKSMGRPILAPSHADSTAKIAPGLDAAIPVSTDADVLSRTQESATTLSRWGWLPEIALLESLGLLIVSWAFIESRTAAASAPTFWWLGLAVMVLPVTLRLASIDASRRERIALVFLLGMALYLIKVMHSPIAFTFPDELSHVRNVGEILESQRLFQENPIQPVIAYYPGLPTITSTLSSLSGLSVFHAGILVIGVARLILFLGLYLLFEQVSGSARVAGLGTVLYMTNPNFLYWTAEYAYEPLALPVLIFVLLMVAKREMGADRTRSNAWTAAAVLGVLTVIITHHMSSYILTVLLGALTVLFVVFSRGKSWGPWQVALMALFATSMWLIFIANLTIDYLSPVLSGAIQSLLRMIAEEETGRELFKSTTLTTESPAPFWEQIVAMGSVIVITLGLPLGVLEIWHRHRSKVFAVLLGMIALSYLPIQMLRFTKDGWETANRSSEFLFIGIAFVLALGIVRYWLSNWTGAKSRMLLAGLSVALFFGGIIAGWPPRARLARPYIIDTGEHVVRPQVVTVAEWMAEYLGPDNRIAASKADAKILGAYGQYPFTDNGPIKNMFLSEDFGTAEQTALIKRDIQYVMSDRKGVSWDHMIGYYFYSQYSDRASDLRVVDTNIAEKLDGVDGIPRLLDSGDIVIYSFELYLEAYKTREASANPETSIITIPNTASNTNASADTSGGQVIEASYSPVRAWTTSTAETSPGADQAEALTTDLPPPGCMWYTMQPSDSQVDLDRLNSFATKRYRQLACLDWSSP